MRQNPNIAFILRNVEEYGLRRLIATVMQTTVDGVTSLSYTAAGRATALDEFEVTAYVSHDSERAWGYTHYFQPFIVDLHRAKTMHEVLRRVDRGMERLRASAGVPDDYHTYLMHIASALAIRRFYLPVQRPNGEKSVEPADAVAVGDWIREQERKYCRRY